MDVVLHALEIHGPRLRGDDELSFGFLERFPKHTSISLSSLRRLLFVFCVLADRTTFDHRNNIADITKLNISTSSDALTTALVVASEVPSMVGSAW